MTSVSEEGLAIIGREKERKLLSELLDDAKKSQGQTVFISGEAGIGKSKLVEFLDSEAKKMEMNVCRGECTEQESSQPYNPITSSLAEITGEEIFSLEEFASFNDVFLISKIGLLITHVSRSSEEGMDKDILSSMLTAVQDFVRDSFGGGAEAAPKSGLGKLEYMNTKILIEHGDLVYLAAVVPGEEHSSMRKDLKSIVQDIEGTYFDILADWDGDLDKLGGTEPILKKIVDKKYRVKRSLENVNIETERLKVQTKIHETVEKISVDKPLLFILEDIHWADESTLLSIPYIARNIANEKILFCLTYRPEGSEAESCNLNKVIESVTHKSQAHEIKLGRLDEKRLETLIRQQLGFGQAPEELVSKLKSETGGNPFYTIEVIRALISEGTLVEDKGIWIMKRDVKESVPSSVTELVSRRLESLDLDSLRLIEIGAVLGRRFEKPLLASGLRNEERQINDTLDKLVEQKILDRLTAGEFRFQHAKFQEVVYSGMSDRWRRMLHRNAGETLESMYKDDIECVLFKLAYHFGRTREYGKGIDYSISAGYKASNNFAPKEAVQFFERATCLIDESGKADDRYPEITGLLGDLYDLDGEYQSAIRTYEKLLKLTSDKNSQSETIMKIGRVFQNRGEYENAIQKFTDALNMAGELGNNILKARINGYMGKIQLRKGEYEKALNLQMGYLEESRKVGEKKEVGQAYMNLGGVYWHMNDHTLAIKSWEDSLRMFSEAGYEQGIANVNDNLGVGYNMLGKFDKSLEYYMKSEVIMKKIGDVRGLSMVLLNIGVLYDRMGQHEKSLEYYMKSLQIKKKIGDNIGVANVYNNIGVNYVYMEKYEEAVHNFYENLKLMEKCGDTWGVAQALSNMAESEIELGRIKDAKEHCRRSLELAEKHSLKDIVTYVYMLQGIMANSDKKFKVADELFAKSLSLAKETEERSRIGMVYLSIGKSLVQRGEKEKAVNSLASALKVFEESHIETLVRKTRLEMQKVVDSAKKRKTIGK
jgi:predicted ATPase